MFLTNYFSLIIVATILLLLYLKNQVDTSPAKNVESVDLATQKCNIRKIF